MHGLPTPSCMESLNPCCKQAAGYASSLITFGDVNVVKISPKILFLVEQKASKTGKIVRFFGDHYRHSGLIYPFAQSRPPEIAFSLGITHSR